MADAGGIEVATGPPHGGTREPTRILVADPHPLVVEALGMRLGSEPDLELLAGIGDRDELRAAVARLEPDAALVAFDLWPAPGPRLATETVAALASMTALILIYDEIEAREVWQCVRAGVRGIVSRGAPPAEFVAALRRMIGGGNYLDAASQRSLTTLIRSRDGGEESPLTSREREVLRLSAEGLTTEQIARRMELSPSSIKATLQRIYMKLGVHDRPAAVAQALRRHLIS